MKCVKNAGGWIERVTEDHAAKLVASNKARYCGKEEWKKQKKANKTKEAGHGDA